VESFLKIILGTFFKYFSKLSPNLTAKIAWSFFCKPRIRKKPLTNFETDLLQRSKQYTISSGEYEISVYEWQNTKISADSKTIIFTHGWGGHALNFSRIIAALIENNYSVIAYDSPAHGNSSGNQTNLLCNTQALLDIAKPIGTIYALIGHSFGNMANTYALDLRQNNSRFPAVEKIILIAGPDKLSDIFASFTQAMQLPDNVLNLFHQRVEKLANRKIKSMSVSGFLQSYTGRTLVIHDQKDRIVPFSEAESVAKNSAAELFSTAGNGHFRILTTDSAIDKIVNFLN